MESTRRETKDLLTESAVTYLDHLAGRVLRHLDVADIERWLEAIKVIIRHCFAWDFPLDDGSGRSSSRLTSNFQVIPQRCQDTSSAIFFSGCGVRRSVAHKRMKVHIQSPKILLLMDKPEATSVMTLSNFESKTDKEAFEVVQRILRVGPDIVLTTDNASRQIVECFYEAGITLVAGVRGEELELLSHVLHVPPCTLATVSNAALAQCDKFETNGVDSVEIEENISVSDPCSGEDSLFSDPILCFHNSKSSFRTVVCSDRSEENLVKLTSAITWMISASLWNTAELAFLVELCYTSRLSVQRLLSSRWNSQSGTLSDIQGGDSEQVFCPSPYIFQELLNFEPRSNLDCANEWTWKFCCCCRELEENVILGRPQIYDVGFYSRAGALRHLDISGSLFPSS